MKTLASYVFELHQDLNYLQATHQANVVNLKPFHYPKENIWSLFEKDGHIFGMFWLPDHETWTFVAMRKDLKFRPVCTRKGVFAVADHVTADILDQLIELDNDDGERFASLEDCRAALGLND